MSSLQLRMLAFQLFKPQMSVGKAAVIAILGVVIVFAVLAVLVGLLSLFKLVFTRIGERAQKKTVTEPESVEPISSFDGDEEVVAAIAAVLACLDSEKEEAAPFRIKSIKKLK